MSFEEDDDWNDPCYWAHNLVITNVPLTEVVRTLHGFGLGVGWLHPAYMTLERAQEIVNGAPDLDLDWVDDVCFKTSIHQGAAGSPFKGETMLNVQGYNRYRYERGEAPITTREIDRLRQRLLDAQARENMPKAQATPEPKPPLRRKRGEWIEYDGGP